MLLSSHTEPTKNLFYLKGETTAFFLGSRGSMFDDLSSTFGDISSMLDDLHSIFDDLGSMFDDLI